jgi:hypothetical protein
MTNLNVLAEDFEDIICEASEQFTGQEIYDALNEAILKQMEWHQKELKSLQDLQWLMTGAPLRDLFDSDK